MAIGQSDGSIVLNTKINTGGLQKGFSSIVVGAKKMGNTVGKAFLAIGAAATAATVAIVKSSVDAYAEYEQLVDGVETLFKGSSKKLIEYANEAYKTAGLSANEYMQTVTSFSASLISSLGGDTEKAADAANQALIDMSDNANKMGTSMEAIQNAYQGFAKQNYTMLDNLKLGYGGTKTEMERLLKDAQALTGVEYDISNLADVYSAIHAIQENLGITGTTAKEAATTISGSAATMKAAWRNVLTAISGGGDLDKAIENLVDSVSNYFKNIVPVIERALSGIGTLIERIAPQLVQTVGKALIQAIPSLLNAVYQMIIGLAKGIYEGIKALFTGGTVKVVEEQTSQIAKSVENQKALTEEVKNTEKAMNKALAGFDDLQIISSGTAESAENLENVTAANVASTFDASQLVGEAENVDASPFEEFFARILRTIQPVIDATKIWTSTLDFSRIKNSFESLLTPLQNFGKIIQDVLYWGYTEILLPLSTWTINSLAPKVIDTLGKAFDALNKFIKPVWDGIKKLNEYLKPIYEKIGDAVIHIVEKLGDVFSNVGDVFEEKSPKIQGIFEMIGEVVQKIWKIIEPIFNWLMELFDEVCDFIDDAVSQIIDIFYDLILFIKNIFAGDWQGAWDSILSVFKGIINLIIDAINVFIRGLNKIQFSLPNWDILGDWAGKEIGINIPEIPRLAQGAVIPANREFLAVLGDQKQGVNIEAPLQTIVDAFNMALQNNGGYNANKTEVVLEIDGREFGRAVVEQGNRESRRIGTRLVIA